MAEETVVAVETETEGQITQVSETLNLIKTRFGFKSETILDANGKPVLDEKGKKKRSKPRDPVFLQLPVPTIAGISAILDAGGKQVDLLMEGVVQVIKDRARQILAEDDTLIADTFPYEQLSWETIANLPPAKRRGGGIATETWDAFYDDYIAVMTSVTNRDPAKVEKAAKHFVNRLQQAKFNKPVLKFLKDSLNVWFLNTEQKESLAEVYEFLDQKCDEFLVTDEEAALAGLS